MIEKHEDYFSVQEVAELLKISRQAVKKQVLYGKLKAFKIGKVIVLPKEQFGDKIP